MAKIKYNSNFSLMNNSGLHLFYLLALVQFSMLIIKKTNAKYITMFLAANISYASWVILWVFTFWVPCCDVRFDFRIETMFGSSLPLVVWGQSLCLIYVICVTLRIVVSNTYCVICRFVFLHQCCKCLWIIHFWMPLQYL